MKVIVSMSREVKVPDKFLPLMNDEYGDYFNLHREFCEYISKTLDMPFSSDIGKDHMGNSIDGVYGKEEWIPLIEC
jgi:hypothetical protein